MPDKLKRFVRAIHPARLSTLASYLLRDEAISGKLILGAVALALIAANSPLADGYRSIWATHFDIGLGQWALDMDLRHWVNEGLMTIFFLVVGLELSRELDRGELRDHRTAILPIAAAVGGMIVPALIFLAFNLGTSGARGWAIPTATDIALAIGVITLVGKRIPSSIRIFLLTLAIADDILAVFVIGLFYSAGVNWLLLLLAAVIATVLYLLRNSRFMSLPLYLAAGVVLWLVIYQSGIHSSITGAILGLLVPLGMNVRKEISIAERVERSAIPLSTLVVVPLFTFANTGISLGDMSISSGHDIRLVSGVLFGLVLGKVLGITGAAALTVRLGLAKLPTRATWNHIIGVGMLAGIGFTVSVFVTELAFTDPSQARIAKASIFLASALSALIGYVSLRYMNPKTGVIDIDYSN